MCVIAWQTFTGFSIADYESFMDFSQVRYRDDLSETGHSRVSGRLDAVGSIQPSNFLGILAVINDFQSR